MPTSAVPPVSRKRSSRRLARVSLLFPPFCPPFCGAPCGAGRFGAAFSSRGIGTRAAFGVSSASPCPAMRTIRVEFTGARRRCTASLAVPDIVTISGGTRV